MKNTKAQLQTTFEIIPDEQVPNFYAAKYIMMRLRICHDGLNRNRSAFTLTGFEKAKESLYNTPVLGHVLFDEDGQPQFGGHDWSIEADAEGNSVTHYEEVPIGVIPEHCNYSIEEYQGRNYVCADALIWRDYANSAEEIIERDREIQLSMEVDIHDYSYDSRYGVFNITDYTYRGVTFLGNDHTPAMAEAGATIAQYTQTTHEHFDQMWCALQSDLKDYVNEMEANTLSEEKTNIIEESPTQEEQFADDPVDVSEEAAPTESESTTETEDAPAEEAPAEEHEATTAKQAYALISNIVDSVYRELGEYTMEFEGYTYSKYIFEDIDTDKQLVYVYSMEDGNYYSVPYSVEGDSVTLVRNFKRQVLSFRDYVPGQESSPMPDSTRSEVSAQAYVAYKEACANYEKELEELRAFKTQTLAAQKQAEADAIFESFADLAGNEEFETLKAKVSEYEIADLEKECYALRGKSVPTKFSAPKQSGLRIPIATPSEDAPSSRVAEMITKFKKG